MTKKIIVRMKGGLGNQLFSYAAARRLAFVNNVELVIDDVTGFARDYQHRRQYMLDKFNITARKATSVERMEPFGLYRRGVGKLLCCKMLFEERHYLEQEGRDFDERLLSVKVKKTLYLDGYWQSEDYFKDAEEIIRQDLQIIPSKDEVNCVTAERILSCNAVAVHVRFFDRPTDKDAFYNLVEDYYVRAIQEILNRVERSHFFLFSDDIDCARKMMKLPENQITCVDHNREEAQAVADLWLMSQCRYFIIANSTFSWWGAWLGQNKGKIVITPDLKIDGKAAWGFKGLIPRGWVKI